MPTYNICRVCLRTENKLQELDGRLLELFQDFCGKTIGVNYCCSFCQHLLKKTYNFKNQCRQSYHVFENWRKTKSQNKTKLSDLYKKNPLTNYGTFKLDQHKTTYETEKHITDITIKVEKSEENPSNDTDDKNNYINGRMDDTYDKNSDINDRMDDTDDKNNYINGRTDDTDDRNYDNNVISNEINDKSDHNVTNENNDELKTETDFDNDVDTDDDKCLIEFISKDKNVKGVIIRKEKNYTKRISSGTKTKKQKQRKPLKDHKEYESVFDIQWFRTEAEVQSEFQGRKTSPRYLAAPYKCTVCFTVYKCQKLADFHMRWHLPAAGEFPCDVCAMRFKCLTSMRKHKNDVHFGRFACKKCPLITYHKMVMILHYRKHQGVSYVCKICSKTYNHSSTYMSHLRKSHPSEHVCVTCAQTFVSEKGLAVHRKKVHNASSKTDANGTARCDECDLTFANQQVYTVHLLNTDKHKQQAETIVACPECGVRFPDKLQVRAHRRERHPQYNFTAMKRAESGVPPGHTCPLCGAAGTENTWLYRHFRSTHPTHDYETCVGRARRRHLCDQCGKGFYNITQLKEHAFAHAGLKPFGCDQCPAAFSSKSHLKFHSERHAPPRRACAHCGKKFVSAANLANHVRSHIGDRRYKCSLCGKGFLHCAALREHVRGVHLHIRRQRKCK